MVSFQQLVESGKYRRYFLKNFTTPAHLGAYSHEYERIQPVRINIEALVPLELSTSRRDALEDVLNYDVLTDAVKTSLKGGHIVLQETLIDRIADKIMAYPQIYGVHITCEKTQAYAEAESVGVEIWRIRED
jgi:dihydroneopterin aldolase